MMVPRVGDWRCPIRSHWESGWDVWQLHMPPQAIETGPCTDCRTTRALRFRYRWKKLLPATAEKALRQRSLVDYHRSVARLRFAIRFNNKFTNKLNPQQVGSLYAQILVTQLFFKNKVPVELALQTE